MNENDANTYGAAMSINLPPESYIYEATKGRDRTSADEVQTSADEVQVSGSHYKDMPIQPWALMEAVLTVEEFRGFLKGNIIKYSMRAGRKEGSDDAGKAKHYMQKLKEVG